jgi:hypothetical protein
MEQTSPVATADATAEDDSSASAPERARPKRQFKPFKQFVLDLIKEVDSEGKDERKQRAGVITTNWNYYRGNHFGFLGKDGTWKQLLDTTGLHRFNQFGQIVDALAKEWAAAGIEINVDPRSSDPMKVAAASVGQDISELYIEKLWDEWFEQAMAKYAMLSRRYWIYTRHSTEVEGYTEQLPISEKKDVRFPGIYVCEQGMTGPVERLEKATGPEGQALTGGCPHCGGRVEIIGGFDEQLPVRTGYEDVNTGDLTSEIVDPAEIEISIESRLSAENSPWLRRVRRTKLYKIENMHPDYVVGAGTDKANDFDDFPGVYEQDRLARSSGTNGYLSGDDYPSGTKSVLYKQYWFKEEMYRSWVSPSNSRVAGVEIKQGQKLTDIFPDGLYVAMCDGDLLCFANEDKDAVWVMGVYKIDPTSPDGKGLEDLVDIQRMQNEIVSLIFDHLMRNASPPTIVDGQLINGDDFTGDPGTISYTKQGFIRDKPISNFIHQLFGPELGGDIFNFFTMTSEAQKNVSSVHDVMTGGGDPGTETFRGLALLREQSTSSLVPALMIKAWVKERWTAQVLEIVRQTWPLQRYLDLKKDWGETAVRAFQKSNIKRDFKIRYTPGTHIPRTNLEELQNILQFLKNGGIDPNVPEKIKVFMARRLGVQYEANTFEKDLRSAKIRFEKMRNGVRFYEQRGMPLLVLSPQGERVANPQLVAAVSALAPVKERTDNHTVHIDFYIEQIKSLEEDQSEESLFFEAVILEKIAEHDDAIVHRAQDMAADSVEAQQPIEQAQKEAAAAQAEEETVRDQQKAEHASSLKQAEAQAAQPPLQPPVVSAPQLGA